MEISVNHPDQMASLKTDDLDPQLFQSRINTGPGGLGLKGAILGSVYLFRILTLPFKWTPSIK